MTSDSERRPSPEEARQALTAVSDSQRALGPFVGSPWWLYPAQGLGMGLFIIGLVLSKSHGWATVVLAVSVIIFCVLPLLQSARSRVILDVYTHRGSRLLGLIYLGLFAAVVAGALLLHAVVRADWMVYGAALLVFILTLIFGPAMEARQARWIGAAH